MTQEERLNWVNGIYEDGEWVSWDHLVNEFDSENDWDIVEKTKPSTLKLWELLDNLLECAKNYLETTGRHLPIYGEIGELFGEIKYNIKRHKPNAQGSDGRMGNDHVEIKTISPHKNEDKVSVKRSGNFNKLLIVKISTDFKIKSKMIDRKELNKGKGKYAKVPFKD